MSDLIVKESWGKAFATMELDIADPRMQAAILITVDGLTRALPGVSGHYAAVVAGLLAVLDDAKANR